MITNKWTNKRTNLGNIHPRDDFSPLREPQSTDHEFTSYQLIWPRTFCGYMKLVGVLAKEGSRSGT